MGQDNAELGDNELSLDVRLELLANHQRRVILRFFIESETDYAPIDEIISEIADDELARTGDRPDDDSITAELYHVHLPKLADAGVIECDPRHLCVRYRGDSRLEELYEEHRSFEKEIA